MQSMRRKRLRKWAVLIVLLVCLYLGFCYSLALGYIHPRRVVPAKPPWAGEVLVPSRFGPTPCWATKGLSLGHPSKVVFVLVHGYGGTRGSWSDAIKDLHDRGYDSLTLAMPGQDASPAKSVGFGLSEAHVIVDAVHWLRGNTPPHTKIVVLGVSMGGAATWIASAEDPSIDGIITEGAYARFGEAMNCFFERKMWGGSFILAPVVSIAKRLTGLQPESVRPVDQAARWKGKPALIIQGGADTLITADQASDLAAAAGCPEWIVPGAQHAQCYEVQKRQYLDHIVHFAEALVK